MDVRDGASSDEPARGVIRTSYPFRILIRRDRLANTSAGQQLAIAALTRRGERDSLPVSWTWGSPIEVFPSRLHFGILAELTSNPLRVRIQSAEDRAFRILAISGDEAGSVVSAGDEPIGSQSPTRKVHWLSLKLHVPRAETRAAAGTMTVLTDDTSCPRLPVYWSAFVDREQGVKSQAE